MSKRLLIDAAYKHMVRMAVTHNGQLEDFDVELASRNHSRGNIYLAKVTRVEPSLQACFVEYGNDRNGFLPFSEIHTDYYRIPTADRLALQEAVAAASRARRAREEEEDRAAEAAIDGDSDDETHQYNAALEKLDEDSVENSDDSEVGEDSTEENLEEDASESSESSSFEGRSSGGRFQLPKYKIQEVIKKGQIMLIQVDKEERGSKGAAVSTFLSLPGRYCVLMPNTPHGGGISRKITNAKDRRKMRQLLSDLTAPDGMSVIIRTAGMERSKPEIKRDLDYLLRLWSEVREKTLVSNAPELIYEEGNLIQRAIRDTYSRDIEEVMVAGAEGFELARSFMRMMMPTHANKVKFFKEEDQTLFQRYGVESQIDSIHRATVDLKSGGSLVIHQTEALVAIDVNSGRAIRERNIEETAFRTNMEAAEEVARQLRLRDLGGLVVVDFIDMEDSRHDAAVERKIRESMKWDRARIQIGRISPFGLLELSRQRLRPSVFETHFEVCSHCRGSGWLRSIDSACFVVLRGIEEEAMRQKATALNVAVSPEIAHQLLNEKRDMLVRMEQQYGVHIYVRGDSSMAREGFSVEKVRGVLYDPAPMVEAVHHRKATLEALIRDKRIQDAMPIIVEEEEIESDEDASVSSENIEELEGSSNRTSSNTKSRRRRPIRGSRRGGRTDSAEATEGAGTEGAGVAQTEESSNGAENLEISGAGDQDSGEARGSRSRRRRRPRSRSGAEGGVDQGGDSVANTNVKSADSVTGKSNVAPWPPSKEAVDKIRSNPANPDEKKGWWQKLISG